MVFTATQTPPVADLPGAIAALKHQRKAVILAHYYQFAGSELWVPDSHSDRPNREFLEWHGDTVFRA